jgi:hypothetical protein
MNLNNKVLQQSLAGDIGLSLKQERCVGGSIVMVGDDDDPSPVNKSASCYEDSTITLKTEATTSTPSARSSESSVATLLSDQRFRSIVSSCSNLNDDAETRKNQISSPRNNAKFVIPNRKNQVTEEKKETLLTKGAEDPFAQLGINKFSVAVYPRNELMAEYNAKRQRNELASDETKKAVTLDDIWKGFIKAVHPDDRGTLDLFLKAMMARAENWDDQEDSHSAPVPVSVPVRIINQKLGCYRYQECRARLTQLNNGLIIADGCFLDITQLREREDELETKTKALQREIQHHQSTQSALHEALNDIREANQKLQHKNEELEKKTRAYEREIRHHKSTQSALEEALKDIQEAANGQLKQDQTTSMPHFENLSIFFKTKQMKNRDLGLEDLMDDLSSLSQLLAASDAPENKWAKKIAKEMAAKLETAIEVEQQRELDDEVSEVSLSS